MMSSAFASAVVAVGLLGLQIFGHGDDTFAWFGWNLFLAWVPLGAAAVGARSRGWVAGVAGAVWLVFLPNAPYLVTDVVHVGLSPAPRLDEAVLCGAFAVAGLAAGGASVALVRQWIEERAGRVVAEVATALACGLAGVGVWLGRVRRYDSWDLLEEPLRILGDVAILVDEPGPRLGMWSMVAATGALLWAAGRTVGVPVRSDRDASSALG